MKWENDPLKYEKYILLDAIVAFFNKEMNEKSGATTLGQLIKFIDDYFQIQLDVLEAHDGLEVNDNK